MCVALSTNDAYYFLHPRSELQPSLQMSTIKFSVDENYQFQPSLSESFLRLVANIYKSPAHHGGRQRQQIVLKIRYCRISRV